MPRSGFAILCLPMQLARLVQELDEADEKRLLRYIKTNRSSVEHGSHYDLDAYRLLVSDIHLAVAVDI